MAIPMAVLAREVRMIRSLHSEPAVAGKPRPVPESWPAVWEGLGLGRVVALGANLLDAGLAREDVRTVHRALCVGVMEQNRRHLCRHQRREEPAVAGRAAGAGVPRAGHEDLGDRNT